MEEIKNSVSGQRYFLAGAIKGFAIWLILWVLTGWAAGPEYSLLDWTISALFFCALFGLVDLLDKKYTRLSLWKKFLILVIGVIVWNLVERMFFPNLPR